MAAASGARGAGKDAGGVALTAAQRFFARGNMFAFVRMIKVGRAEPVRRVALFARGRHSCVRRGRLVARRAICTGRLPEGSAMATLAGYPEVLPG